MTQLEMSNSITSYAIQESLVVTLFPTDLVPNLFIENKIDDTPMDS